VVVGLLGTHVFKLLGPGWRVPTSQHNSQQQSYHCEHYKSFADTCKREASRLVAAVEALLFAVAPSVPTASRCLAGPSFA